MRRISPLISGFVLTVAGNAFSAECDTNAPVDSPAFWACNKKPSYQDPLAELRATSTARVTDYAGQVKGFLAKGTAAQALKLAQATVAASLKDPGSAQFRKVRLANYAGGKVVCGEVNARNSYGGYAGFTPFVASTTAADIYYTDRQELLQQAANAGLDAACNP